MSEFGDPLKEAREARGLSLEAVVDATRIPRHHLAAIERSDIEALPSGPFAKGYIEAYAKLLSIDPGPILDAYRAEGQKRGIGTPEAQNRMIDELTQLVGQRSGTSDHVAEGRGPGWKTVAIVSSAAFLLAIGGWLLTRDRTPDDPVATSSRPSAPPSAGVAARPETPFPPADPPRRSDSEAPREPAPLLEAAGGTAPSSVPEPAPEPAAPRPNPNITIPDSGVGTGVENHRLVGNGDRFPEGSEVVFWNRVVGGEAGNAIHHVWLHEGRGIARIPLTIGGSHWRTFSSRPLPAGAAGSWVVEARDLDGRVLARREFSCVPRER